MHPMSQSNAVDLKYPKSFLFGTSALVCLALAAPVLADDFVITSSDGSTNGVGTKNGGAAAAISDVEINGGDTITLEGALEPTSGNEGIETTGSNTTTISGSITTQGFDADGIDHTGNNNFTNVTGSITTDGQYSEAIYNDGDYNTTTISGSILTKSTDSQGIQNSGNFNETIISSSGIITTLQDDGYGIYNDGNNNTTTVSGSITTGVVGTTNGDDATGVWNSGTGNTTTLTSTGVITVRGPIADGIYNDGGTSTTIVHGSISVSGDGTSSGAAEGIHNEDNGNTTTISSTGLITSSGNYNRGIHEYDDNNFINMHGFISLSGDESEGIQINGDNNTTTVSGTISATGTNSNAILVYSSSGNSFTLDEGAVIIGDITALAAATNSKLKFNLGEGLSYAYSVGGGGAGTGAGQWTFTDQDGRTQGVTTDGTGCDTTITVCNLVTGVSTGNVEAQDELQFSMNSSMIGSLEFGSGQADAPAEAMSFTQSSKSNTWTNVYGGTSKRASSTTKLAFDTSNRGLTIGTPVSINDTLDVDLVFNVSRTSLDIGLTKDQEITSNSYNLGAVLRDLAPSTGWAVDAFGFIGRNFYDGKRKVMNNQEATGSETVTAAYSGSEVLVGVDAQYSNPINDTLNFIGGVNASLSNEKIGAYSESKYYSWDARTMAQASGGITAGLEYHTDALTTFANLGVQGMSQRSGKTATYTNNGTAGSYTNNSRGDIYRTASVGFDYKAEDGLSFTGAIERFSSTGGVSGNSASLTANWSF
jgi:hypothetical protein